MGLLSSVAGAYYGTGFLLFGLILYVIVALPTGGVLQKAGQPFWAGFVPIYNYYLILKIVGRPTWWLAFILLGIIPFIGSIAVLIIAIIVGIDLAKSFGRSTGDVYKRQAQVWFVHDLHVAPGYAAALACEASLPGGVPELRDVAELFHQAWPDEGAPHP